MQWQSTGDAGFELHKYITPGRPQQLTFNTSEGPFTDERVRQAFAYCVDREAIVETIGHGVIPYEGNGGVSQTTPGYSEKAAELVLARPRQGRRAARRGRLDRRRRRRLPDEGRRDASTVVLPYGAGSIINADGASILQGVQEQAKQAGFEVELIPVPQAELFAGGYCQPDERDIYPGYWTAVTSRHPLHQLASGNRGGAELLERLVLRTTPSSRRSSSRPTPPPTSTSRTPSTPQAQEYIAEHALAIGVYDRLSTLAVSPKLQGVWQEHAQGGPTFYDAHFVE